MPPPNVAFIAPAYVKCLEALKATTKVGTKAIEACVTSFLAGLDYGLTGKVVAWVVEKVISTLFDWETKALAIVLRCEYIMAMDGFLMANDLNHKRNDATELVGAVEDDGWWEWLVGE